MPTNHGEQPDQNAGATEPAGDRSAHAVATQAAMNTLQTAVKDLGEAHQVYSDKEAGAASVRDQESVKPRELDYLVEVRVGIERDGATVKGLVEEWSRREAEIVLRNMEHHLIGAILDRFPALRRLLPDASILYKLPRGEEPGETYAGGEEPGETYAGGEIAESQSPSHLREQFGAAIDRLAEGREGLDVTSRLIADGQQRIAGAEEGAARAFEHVQAAQARVDKALADLQQAWFTPEDNG